MRPSRGSKGKESLYHYSLLTPILTPSCPPPSRQESMWGYTATTLTHGVCLSLATDDLHDILRRETFAAASRHLRRVVVRMQARKITSLLAKVVEPVNEICRTMITIRNRLHMRG